jgi:hypothetical protein
VIESLTGQGIDVRHACRPDPPRTLRRIWPAGEIADVHKASGGTYGEMRVTAELRHGREIRVSHNTVGQIMREIGLKGLPTRRLPRERGWHRSPRLTSSGGCSIAMGPTSSG